MLKFGTAATFSTQVDAEIWDNRYILDGAGNIYFRDSSRLLGWNSSSSQKHLYAFNREGDFLWGSQRRTPRGGWWFRVAAAAAAGLPVSGPLLVRQCIRVFDCFWH
eukprot:TRINITY_DN2968_c1_g1_i2.p3 TRINITY_DN2968_c1_g1~~TRINITY_DN2968_c1_g1_i2.p3  ORF type:complete len:106 (-),score=6.27 TRINITY_DN2968_c1_g1_i2:81-398(-)